MPPAETNGRRFSAEPVHDRQGGMYPKGRGVGRMLAQAKCLLDAVGDGVAGDVLVGSHFDGAAFMIQIASQRVPEFTHTDIVSVGQRAEIAAWRTRARPSHRWSGARPAPRRRAPSPNSPTRGAGG